MSESIQVFISYCETNDGKHALELANILKSDKIKPILAKDVRDSAIENSEKIAKLIGMSHFFITFYTTNGSKNQWVNQELGYAFHLVSCSYLKIIPIYNSMDDFRGFLTSKSHNLDTRFILDESKSCFKELKKYIEETYSHPLSLRAPEFYYKYERGWHLKFQLANDSAGMQDNVRIDIIVPDWVEINIHDNRLIRIRDDINRYQISPSTTEDRVKPEFYIDKSTIIPHPVNYKFDNKSKSITRYTAYLNKVHIHNAEEFIFTLGLEEDLEEFYFGIYITAPLYGETYYQGYINVIENKVNLEKRDAERVILINKKIRHRESTINKIKHAIKKVYPKNK